MFLSESSASELSLRWRLFKLSVSDGAEGVGRSDLRLSDSDKRLETEAGGMSDLKLSASENSRELLLLELNVLGLSCWRREVFLVFVRDLDPSFGFLGLSFFFVEGTLFSISLSSSSAISPLRKVSVSVVEVSASVVDGSGTVDW